MKPILPFSFRDHCPPRAGRHAFALVVVLIVISVLALVAVGFLSSMSQERATASAFANKARAEQSAQAGVDTAMGILRDYFKAFPDSATVWDTAQSKNTDGTINEGTSLYLHAVPTDAANLSTDSPQPAPGNSLDSTYNSANYIHGNSPGNTDGTNSADARKVFVLPLVSGATVERLENKANAVRGADDTTVVGGSVKALTTANSVNLNSRRSVADATGWLGTPPGYVNPQNTNGNTLPKPFVVPWVEIKQQDGSANPPVIGRYAFWVEDESFRANVSYAGLGNSHNRRDNTQNFLLNPTDADLLGTTTLAGAADPSGLAQSIRDIRQTYPGQVFPEFRAFTHSAGLTSDTINKLRFLTSAQSSALNLSRHGTQRLNLNSVIYPPVGAAFGTVQNQIDKIVQTLRFHVPNFGQRFYRTKWSGNPPVVAATDLNDAQMVSSTTAAPHTTIYLYKIATNLHDYIASSVVPTVINAGGQIRPNSRPTAPINFTDGTNPVWAMGKDTAPFLQEAAVRFTGNASGSSYTVNVDYYIEVWNMSTQPVTGQSLGPNAFIRVLNPPKWMGDKKSSPTTTQTTLQDGSGHSLSDTRDVIPPGRDFDIDISAAIFSPGACTVITTDPDWQSAVSPTGTDRSITDPLAANQNEVINNHRFVVCPFISPGKRTYTGAIPPNCDEVRMLYGTTSSSDYETEVIIGNDHGYIDSLAGAIPMQAGVISMPVGASPRPVYGGYLRGNLASGAATGGLQPSELGDPRTNNEQLSFILHINTGDATDQTGYKRFDLSSNGAQIPPTFGLPNIYCIAPSKPANPWPDYYWFPGNDYSHTITPNQPGSSSTAVMRAQNAPAVVANAPLTSIGQLGDVFDPARLPAISGGDITASRGGGRTLRIGQHDDLYDTTSTNPASAGWASWRLADFFAISDNIEQPGLININGLARDNGAALQAAYAGFVFQSQTSDYYLSDGVTPNPSYDAQIHGDAALAGIAYNNSTGLQNLIADIIGNRLKNSDPTKINPFYERGEISETSILNPANYGTANFAGAVTSAGGANVDMRTVFDRGREELIRRLLEMITTRGNVFTVYAVGQSINQTNAVDPATKRVLATHQLRVTFKLAPKNSDGTAFHPGTDSNSDFDPLDPSKVSARFAKPDHYDIQVLSTSSDNG